MNQDAKHTTGPWKLKKRAGKNMMGENISREIYQGNLEIAEVFLLDVPEGEDNASRIVSCVNGLAQTDQKWLESVGYEGVTVALAAGAMLAQQRDLLVETLREIDRDCMDLTHVEGVSVGERRAYLALVAKIRATLAKVLA